MGFGGWALGFMVYPPPSPDDPGTPAVFPRTNEVPAFRVSGSGSEFSGQCDGFRVGASGIGSVFLVAGFGCRVWGRRVGFRVSASGLRFQVQGFGFRVGAPDFRSVRRDSSRCVRFQFQERTNSSKNGLGVAFKGPVVGCLRPPRR